MNRRGIIRRLGMAGAFGAGFAETAAAASPSKKSGKAALPAVKMKVGTQHGSTDEILRTLAAFGVNHICSSLPSPRLDESWSVESLLRLRERVESFGIRLEMVPLPLSSSPIARAENPNILLGKSPEREREVDSLCRMIRNASQAGIPAVKYNMSILGVVRTGTTPGRGGAAYSTFVYDQARQEPPLTEAGPVGADAYWERIEWFLQRVIPVAEECKVRMACHPHDPGMPADKGYRGVNTVLGSIDGLKRFVGLHPSAFHGLNFCQGTVTEMLRNPREEIFEVIRWFGSRGKIFNVHFRNIRGGFLNFQETFLDDGDLDMLRVLRVYREIGYDGMLMPDHVPKIAGDSGGLQAFAFSFGYLKALLAAVSAEG